MIDLQDKTYCPTLSEIAEYVQNPVFDRFCTEIGDTYRAKPLIEFSSCSWMPGWNIKYKKSGKSLCTIYPNETYFTVLVVVGKKEKEAAEALLLECTAEMRDIYRETEEGNGQRWLMVELDDDGDLYKDVMGFVKIRAGKKA